VYRREQVVLVTIPDVLDGRVAIVTGAGRGIGRAHALRLATYGAMVVVNDAGVATDGATTDETPADEVVDAIRAAGGQAVAQRGSVADTATGAALVQLALDTWGRLDIVVNNAGIGRPRMVFNLTDDEWDDVIAVHLRGTFGLTRAACRWWRDDAKRNGSTYGRVVNTSTGLLMIGGAGQSNYVAAKAAVAAFTDAVAQEMARYGVTANTLMPGAMTRLAAIGWRMARTRDDAGHDAEGAPFDPTDPGHVAEFVCYLASPAAGWISGQTFQVSGAKVQHVSAWDEQQVLSRDDAGWTAGELADEVPRMFGAGPKRAEQPPKEWSEAYHAEAPAP
jgi:NAD(P)-dependent dehydrogenase (short-subunit alcohol dehydrogenase family)